MKEYIRKIKDNFFNDRIDENNTKIMGLGLLIFLICILGSIIFLGGFLNYEEKTEVFVISLIPTVILLPAINFFHLSITIHFRNEEKNRKWIYVYYLIILLCFTVTTFIYILIHRNDNKMIVLYGICDTLIWIDFLLYVSRLSKKKPEIYVKIALFPMIHIWFMAFHFGKEKSTVKDIIRYISISMFSVLIQCIICLFFVIMPKSALMWKMCVILIAVSGIVTFCLLYRFFDKKDPFSISGWRYLQFYIFCMNILYLCLKFFYIDSFENLKSAKDILNISANEFLLPTVTAAFLFLEIFFKQKLDKERR